MKPEQLMTKLKALSNQTGVSPQILLKIYMFNSFLERLSISKYKDNFILKGGFYLSSLFSLAKRTTQDIDAMLQDTPFTEENLNAIFKKIFSIDVGDGIILQHIKTEPIRNRKEYRGFRVKVKGNLENIRDNFCIDVATGDEVVPHKLEYSYTPLLEEKEISIYAYNLETVLAEKLETLFELSTVNGRMKDYYDIYLIYQINKNKINIDILKRAVQTVFFNRHLIVQYKDVLKLIEKNEGMYERWSNYSKKHPFAKEIRFEDVLTCINNICKDVELI